MQVSCEHPKIILNPHAPSLLFQYRHYILNGVEHRQKYSYRLHPYDFDYHTFSPKFNNITLENVDSNVIIDDETGEAFPLYLVVPCGHCDICKVSKINSFVKRCEYESQCYNSLPWFVTLTYAHEPKDGVSVRDCQLFLKRFRINLKRAGFNFLIRYYLVAEYGQDPTKTQRAHYHAVFWNINAYNHDEYVKIGDILEKSWSHGFVMHRLVDLKDDKGFFYTMKYVKKDIVVPEGKNDVFFLSSRKNGGIGAPFIDKHKDKIRKSLNTKYFFLNKFTGSVEIFQWSRYVLNRIFPSFCRSVKSTFRDDVIHFFYYLKSYENVFSTWVKDFHSFSKSLYNRLSKYFFIPTRFEHFLPKHGSFSLAVLFDLRCRIECVIDSIDFQFFHDLDGLRHRFLGRLFRYQNELDLVQRARVCNNILSWNSPRTRYV